jgi:Na+/H+ antiporter NhaC
MRSIFLSLCFALVANLSTTWSQAELNFPHYAIEGIDTKVTVNGADNLQEIAVGEKKYAIKLNHGEAFILMKFYRNKQSKYQEYDAQTAIIPSWWAVIPPLVAIIFALLFKEVLVALLSGIFIGAATLGFYTDGLRGIFGGFLAVLDHYILGALANKDHLSVIVFSLLIGAIVALISKNGGMRGVVNRIVKYAQNRRSGMMTTYLLGLAIFFDDYANSLVVGNTMRPVTDKLKISREKLAYLVDSTAAPVSAIAFVTTWIGAELGYISSAVDKINENGTLISEGVYSIFVNSLAYSFYPILTLVFIFLLIRSQRDFGPMLKAERKAELSAYATSDAQQKSKEEALNHEEFEPADLNKVRSFNAVIPILIIVFGTLIGLIFTGMNSWNSEFEALGIDSSLTFFESLKEANPTAHSSVQLVGTIIGNADSYSALLWASLTALFAALVLSVSQGILTLGKSMETVVQGIKTMLPAVLILVLAWSLAEVTKDMNTADVIKNAFGSNFGAWLLPAITFVISAVIAFSTGSSWSTMAIVYPIMLPTAFAVASGSGDPMLIFYNTVASVLAGAVLGDHCSPISDTTILSSLATSCDHIEHVRTQIPYALTVGGVALFIGIIPASFGVSSLLTFPIATAVLYFVIRRFGKKVIDA